MTLTTGKETNIYTTDSMAPLLGAEGWENLAIRIPPKPTQEMEPEI